MDENGFFQFTLSLLPNNTTYVQMLLIQSLSFEISNMSDDQFIKLTTNYIIQQLAPYSQIQELAETVEQCLDLLKYRISLVAISNSEIFQMDESYTFAQPSQISEEMISPHQQNSAIFLQQLEKSIPQLHYQSMIISQSQSNYKTKLTQSEIFPLNKINN